MKSVWLCSTFGEKCRYGQVHDQFWGKWSQHSTRWVCGLTNLTPILSISDISLGVIVFYFPRKSYTNSNPLILVQSWVRLYSMVSCRHRHSRYHRAFQTWCLLSLKRTGGVAHIQYFFVYCLAMLSTPAGPAIAPGGLWHYIPPM